MNQFSSCYMYHKKLTKNKVFEAELSYSDSNPWVSLKLEWSRNRDKSGIRFDLSLMGYSFSIKVYDNRRWNYETHEWENTESPSFKFDLT